jgi:nucleoside-diphosphate-sugar epimerase
MSEMHIIFGTGPAGCWTAHALREKGLPVRAVNRSGKRPGLMPPDVEIVVADASVPREAIKAAEGAAAVYQALNPAYHEWETYFPGLQAGVLAAAQHTGARYISIENLYMYDSSRPMSEDSPIRPRSKKGELRARMADEVMEAHARGEVQAAALRSSDYYGPGVLGSALGEMVFGNLVEGKKARVNGSDGMPHSFAYIQDIGKAAAVLGTDVLALGEVWIAPHAPPVTQGKIVEFACRQFGVEPQISVISPFMMRMAGLFVPGARASVEMLYEFTAPFVVDSTRFEETFGLRSTPIVEGIPETINWYQEQQYLH